MANKKKRKYNPNKNLPPFARILKSKVEKIKSLEKKYWDSINEQRNVLSEIDTSFEEDFNKLIPKQSSLIYACLDGVVLIRLSDYKEEGSVEIKYFESRLQKLLDELPIPNDDKFINFSVITKLGPNQTFEMINSSINDIFFASLSITAFKYNNETKLQEIEDALGDIELTLIGLNSGIYENNDSLGKEKLSEEKLIIRLKAILREFTDLLSVAEKEEELQKYIKAHPILLQPYSKVYPKKKLGEDFITDFVLTNTLNQGVKYTFVEIERVSMPIFTKSGEFTSDFKHTEKQTLDWDLWLEKHKPYLREKLIGLESPEFIVVAGRSNDFNENQNALLRAWNRRQNNLKFFTYDDLVAKLLELISNLEIENNAI